MAKRKTIPWSQRLKVLREKLKLTQAEAARRARITQGQWSRIESGARQPTRSVAFLLELLEDGTI